MTKDEVMAMTDKALQIKAAELMGTERAYLCCEDSFCPATICLYGDEDVYDCIHLREGGDPDGCPEMRRGDLPDYPNDIAAAWELLKKARSVPALMSRFCEAVDDTISDDAWGLLEGLDARSITRAFILAMETINA